MDIHACCNNKKAELLFKDLEAGNHIPFEPLIMENWSLSGKISYDENEKNMLDVNDAIVAGIEIYDNVIIITPAESKNVLKNQGVRFFDSNGSEITPFSDSLSAHNCYFSEAIYTFESTACIEKITVGETEYIIRTDL